MQIPLAGGLYDGCLFSHSLFLESGDLPPLLLTTQTSPANFPHPPILSYLAGVQS